MKDRNQMPAHAVTGVVSNAVVVESKVDGGRRGLAQFVTEMSRLPILAQFGASGVAEEVE